jgi:DNA modification methylase
LAIWTEIGQDAQIKNGVLNRLGVDDRAAHDWYRFVLSFPPHLVRQYIQQFRLESASMLLDPFCGTGTTLVESKKLGIPSAGIESHPMSHFASCIKVDWNVDPNLLVLAAREIADEVLASFRRTGISDEFGSGTRKISKLKTLPAQNFKLLLTDSISPLPLHKTLVLLEAIGMRHESRYFGALRLALAKALVNTISNLHFGPEVGVSKAKPDAPVILPWLSQVEAMAADLRTLGQLSSTSAIAHRADSRQDLLNILRPGSIDAVITSPPYPNEKDYTRTTRLESVLLGFISTKEELQAVKKGLVRSNTRSVYKLDDDHKWVKGHPEIDRIASEIEERRIQMEKTSGFERMYARLTKLYFGGMARHLAELRKVLRPGAHLAYVVGDQASYLRVMIRTGQILGGIAQALGYELENIDLFRTRLATATREQLREEVVILRWPGDN